MSTAKEQRCRCGSTNSTACAASTSNAQHGVGRRSTLLGRMRLLQGARQRRCLRREQFTGQCARTCKAGHRQQKALRNWRIYARNKIACGAQPEIRGNSDRGTVMGQLWTTPVATRLTDARREWTGSTIGGHPCQAGDIKSLRRAHTQFYGAGAHNACGECQGRRLEQG